MFAKLVGISRTALNNYIAAETETQPRVRAPLASYYLRWKAGKVQLPEPKRRKRKLRLVAEARAGYAPEETVRRLEEILPPTREAALRWVEHFAEFVRNHPDEAPPNAEALVPILRDVAKRRPPEKP